jgi:methylated-DNA-protein-cysteine methyltransferase related protein
MPDTGDDFTEAVIATIESIPPGEISTYGEVAQESGYPGAARAVGNLLRTVPGLPWWRVITSTGRLVPDKEAEHARLLRAEGVSVMKGTVTMRGRT